MTVTRDRLREDARTMLASGLDPEHVAFMFSHHPCGIVDPDTSSDVIIEVMRELGISTDPCDAKDICGACAHKDTCTETHHLNIDAPNIEALTNDEHQKRHKH